MDRMGKFLPDFSLMDEQGRTVTRASLAGKWAVLYAYPKDATPGCTTEACGFRDAWSRVEAAGAQVYGISKDRTKSHASFIAKQQLPFSLLSDPEADLLRKLGAFGPKKIFGLESEGIIRSTFLVDPKGIIRHVWPKVSVEGHVEEVLAKLEEMRG